MKKLSRTVQIGMLLFLTPVGISAQKPEPQVDVTLLERARAFLDHNLLIDGHNDLPSPLFERVSGDPVRVNLGTIQPDLPGGPAEAP